MIERFSVCVLLHISLSVLITLFLRSMGGLFYDSLFINISTLVLSSAGAYLLSKKVNVDDIKINIWTRIVFIILFLVIIRVFTYQLFVVDSVWYTNHRNNFGDLPLHIHYIRALVNENPLIMDNPIFSGNSWLYPWGMDFYNSFWEGLKVSTGGHIFLVSILLSFCTLYFVSSYLGWLGLIGLFLSGGMANWRALVGGGWIDIQNTLQWKNFFISIWLTQRGMLFALPVGIYILKKSLGIFKDTQRDGRKGYFYTLIILNILGMALPFFHLHNFLLISVIVLVLSCYHKCILFCFMKFYPIVMVGFFCFFRIYLNRDIGEFLDFHLSTGLNFMKEEGLSLLQSWLFNLGPWVLLWIGSVIYIIRTNNWRGRAFRVFIFMTLIFVLLTFCQITPWMWDGIKVLLWVYLIILWMMWEMWGKRLSLLNSILLSLILGFSGLVSITSATPFSSKKVSLLSQSEVDIAMDVLQGVPRKSTLFIAPEHNHPVLWLGYKVLMGYEGHLWSYGIDYRERVKKLKESFQTGKILKEWTVEYIFFGPRERMFFNIQQLELNPLLWEKVKEVSGVELFRKRKGK